jgi:hypothetical protein
MGSEFDAVASWDETLSGFTAKICKGLQSESIISEKTGRDLIQGFISFTPTTKTSFIVAHSALTSDMGVLAQQADMLGVDFIGSLEAQGVIGIVDTMRIIEEHDIKSLQRTSGRTGSMKQEDLFLQASDGQNMKLLA